MAVIKAGSEGCLPLTLNCLKNNKLPLTSFTVGITLIALGILLIYFSSSSTAMSLAGKVTMFSGGSLVVCAPLILIYNICMRPQKTPDQASTSPTTIPSSHEPVPTPLKVSSTKRVRSTQTTTSSSRQPIPDSSEASATRRMPPISQTTTASQTRKPTAPKDSATKRVPSPQTTTSSSRQSIPDSSEASATRRMPQITTASSASPTHKPTSPKDNSQKTSDSFPKEYDMTFDEKIQAIYPYCKLTDYPLLIKAEELGTFRFGRVIKGLDKDNKNYFAIHITEVEQTSDGRRRIKPTIWVFTAKTPKDEVFLYKIKGDEIMKPTTPFRDKDLLDQVKKRIREESYRPS